MPDPPASLPPDACPARRTIHPPAQRRHAAAQGDTERRPRGRGHAEHDRRHEVEEAEHVPRQRGLAPSARPRPRHPGDRKRGQPDGDVAPTGDRGERRRKAPGGVEREEEPANHADGVDGDQRLDRERSTGRPKEIRPQAGVPECHQRHRDRGADDRDAEPRQRVEHPRRAKDDDEYEPTSKHRRHTDAGARHRSD
jgi:hypothetical protein